MIRVLMVPDWRRGNPYQQLLADSLAENGFQVEFPTGYYRGLPIWRSFRRALKREREPVRVLHLHWHEAYIRSNTVWGQRRYGLRLILDILLVKLSGCRVVWTLHNEVPHDTPNPEFFRKLQWVISYLADAVILHNRSAIQQAARSLNRWKRPLVIPHPHYRDHYGPWISKQEARAQLQLSDDETLFVFFGTVCPYKGVEDLLDAWRLLPQHGRCRLLVVGSPETKAYGGQILAKTRDLQNVEVRFEFVPDALVRTYVCSADCMVLPFRKIMTSGSLTLALSYGIPVVVSDAPYVREVTEAHACEYFESNDVSSLLNAMQRMVVRLATEAGRPPVLQSMGWAEAGKTTASIYSAVLAREAVEQIPSLPLRNR